MITKDNLFYSFSKANKPIEKVSLNKSIIIETVDAFGGQIKSESDTLNSLDWERVNPATGPLYIEGTKPGDLLKVTIEKIELEPFGVMASIPDAGLFGKLHKESCIKTFEIKDNHTMFNELKIELNPMIGVIGVAPLESIPNGEPGPHGGNMDNKLITEGTVLYLPVFVEGALFGLGDLHAAMGDGEVNVTGIEIGGKVTVSFDIIKQASHGHPLMIKDSNFYTIYSDTTLDQSVRGVSSEMLYWLKDALNYSTSDTAMLMSLVGNLEICQVVDPKVTTRMRMPLDYFTQFKNC